MAGSGVYSCDDDIALVYDEDRKLGSESLKSMLCAAGILEGAVGDSWDLVFRWGGVNPERVFLDCAPSLAFPVPEGLPPRRSCRVAVPCGGSRSR